MTHYSGSVPDTEPGGQWVKQAACAGPEYAGHRDIWFPTPGDQETIALAKTICGLCPVQRACLVDALRTEGSRARDNRHGIRGGLTGRQRRGVYERYQEQRRAKQQKATA